MTEQEWLECTDPTPLLTFLQRQMPNGRKLQLFAVACCRSIWRLFADERNRHAITLAERFVDRQASEAEREAANGASYSVYAGTSAPGSGFADAAQGMARSGWEAAQAATLAVLVYKDDSDAGYCAGAAAEQVRNAIVEEAKENHVGVIADYAMRAVTESERDAQVCLLRCIFGNPFQPITINPAWLIWNDGTVRKIAQSIYEERAFDCLPILADALTDAGCDNADILKHCRSEGPHVKGCWVVDLLLGKE